jgi:hypothetical protein
MLFPIGSPNLSIGIANSCLKNIHAAQHPGFRNSFAQKCQTCYSAAAYRSCTTLLCMYKEAALVYFAQWIFYRLAFIQQQIIQLDRH